MSEYAIPTVKVIRPDSPGGYIVINECDLALDDQIFEPAGDLPAQSTEDEAPKPRRRKREAA